MKSLVCPAAIHVAMFIVRRIGHVAGEDSEAPPGLVPVLSIFSSCDGNVKLQLPAEILQRPQLSAHEDYVEEV